MENQLSEEIIIMENLKAERDKVTALYKTYLKHTSENMYKQISDELSAEQTYVNGELQREQERISEQAKKKRADRSVYIMDNNKWVMNPDDGELYPIKAVTKQDILKNIPGYVESENIPTISLDQISEPLISEEKKSKQNKTVTYPIYDFFDWGKIMFIVTIIFVMSGVLMLDSWFGGTHKDILIATVALLNILLGAVLACVLVPQSLRYWRLQKNQEVYYIDFGDWKVIKDNIVMVDELYEDFDDTYFKVSNGYRYCSKVMGKYIYFSEQEAQEHLNYYKKLYDYYLKPIFPKWNEDIVFMNFHCTRYDNPFRPCFYDKEISEPEVMNFLEEFVEFKKECGERIIREHNKKQILKNQFADYDPQYEEYKSLNEDK